MIDKFFYIVIYNVDKKQVFNTLLDISQWKHEAVEWGIKLDIVSVKRIRYDEVL